MQATMDGSFDASRFRQVLGQYPTGVCVVTAIGPDGRPVGMSVGSFTSVSLDPPLVAFMPDKKSTSWPKIRPSGAFCVNVLSAEQDSVCRSFASKAPDKFQGIPWRAASSGSPVIDGVVAWIDCDLLRVDDAGDHEIAIGRVRELDIESKSLPLLFFRGGYGQFTPLTMAMNDADLSEHLRIVDLARTEMESAAAELDGQVVAIDVVGDALVLLASAGRLDPATTWSMVGQRVPAVPPIGTPVVAWQHEDRIAHWLNKLELDDVRKEYRQRLAETRQRGYSVMVTGPELTSFTEMLDSRRLPAVYEKMTDQQRSAIAGLPLDPAHFSPEQAGSVRRIYVPVFGPDGTAQIALGVRLIKPLESAEELADCVDRMQQAARTVTTAIGGRAP
jgi:flavin reductase (DIM6/NTAB) family NADH-FMN oxidoreductase RutF/DNA-binding IclR family transcriptional regulator